MEEVRLGANPEYHRCAACPNPRTGTPDHSSLIGRDDVLAGLSHPVRILVDVRPHEEYRASGYPGRPHHFMTELNETGASHGPSTYYLDRLLCEDGTFRSASEIKAEFEQEGETTS